MNGDGSRSTFDRARRRRFYRRLVRPLRRRERPSDLLPLDEATKRLRPFERRYAGIQSIPVRQIVGTDSRMRDFDRDFLPRTPVVGPRWKRVEEAYPEGGFPPILAYQLGDAYFVLDGHHRVAIARQRGAETIDAEVTVLRARWHLDADADVVQLIHAEQERIFMDDSGLAVARPDLRIRVSRPAHYLELLENVQIHGYHAMRAADRVLPPQEIANDWYERIYRPTVEAIRREGLLDTIPGSTDADHFLWAYHRRRELVPECGCEPLEVTASMMAAERRAKRGLRGLFGPRPTAG